MLNRFDRIVAILIQLQSKKIVKAQSIADRFDISLRTVYRDIKTLTEAGVPIISEAGIGYEIMPGYHLPPVIFTKDEVSAFFTASKLIEGLTDEATHANYQSALYKIKAVLKDTDQIVLDQLHHNMTVLSNSVLPTKTYVNNAIPYVINSLSGQLVLAIKYKAIHATHVTERCIEPVGMFFETGNWYLIAYCLWRKEYRNFRLDRIQDIQFTTQQFSQLHPSLNTYLATIQKEKKHLEKVVILVEKSALPYLGEQKYYHGFVTEQEKNNKMELTFLCHSLEGFARWYMMMGDQAKILTPLSLKTRVKELVGQLKNNL
jgi:predicted DNA-binding transcriptional regulator YafY